MHSRTRGGEECSRWSISWCAGRRPVSWRRRWWLAAGAAGDDEGRGKRLEEEGRGGRWHGVGRGLNGPEGTRGKGPAQMNTNFGSVCNVSGNVFSFRIFNGFELGFEFSFFF